MPEFMKRPNIFQILFCIFSFLLYADVNGQIAILNVSEIPKIKKGITYIVMKDPNSTIAKEYVEVFKNYWTISKLEFIKQSEINNYLSPEHAYLTLGGFESSSHTFVSNTGARGISYQTTNIYLELWTCDKKYFDSNKKNKKFKGDDKIQVARIELFTDFQVLNNPEKLIQADYDGNGHIRNWGAGILKNYVQTLMQYLNKGVSHDLYKEILNAKELRNLKNETLYIPDYVLIKFNKFNGDESKKHKEVDIMEDYTLKYKMISTKELNQKILNEKNNFYYLIYIKSSTDKYVSVMNAISGEIIYSDYKAISYNIGSKDLKKLQEKIN